MSCNVLSGTLSLYTTTTTAKPNLKTKVVAESHLFVLLLSVTEILVCLFVLLKMQLIAVVPTPFSLYTGVFGDSKSPSENQSVL